MSEIDEIKRLENELGRKKGELKTKQEQCCHKWEEPKYDPETYQKAVFSHYEPHGSDPIPVYEYFPQTRQRWSRYCPKCEKTEYTYEQKPVQYVPKFRDN